MKTRTLLIFLLQAALLSVFSGCQILGDRNISEVVEDKAANIKARAYAWNPPGLVVSETFAAFTDNATGKRQVPVKTIDLAEQRVGLIDFLDLAYGLPRVGIMPEKDRAVLRTRGILEEYFPLPMVTRYGLGDVLVTNGDSVGLVDWNMALAQFDPVNAEAELTTIQRLAVSISGLVQRPGDYVITPEAPFPGLTTLQLRLGSLAGDNERVAGEFISSDGVIIPDLYLITRLDRESGRLQKFYIPLQTAEEYEEEEFEDPRQEIGDANPTNDRFAVFDNFKLQDGDSIEVTRTEFLPEIISSRISESTERVVEQYRRDYRQHKARAKRNTPLGRLRGSFKAHKSRRK